jgi:hypothetical protein
MPLFPRKKLNQGARITEGSVPSYEGTLGKFVRRDFTLNVSDTAEGRVATIGYGTNRYQPQVVHAEISGAMLYLVYLLGEGEIDSVKKVYIGSDEIYPTAVAWATVTVKTGSTSQAEITAVPHANWASSYPGRALLYIRLDLSSAKFSGGLPELEVIVRGLRIYDPRTTRTIYSENPFLIARDLLTNTEYGAGISSALLDTTSWNSAADRCDESGIT